MHSTDVLVIGSSAAGMVAATTAKTVNKGKSVTVVRMEEKTLVPCGIPYVFASISGTDDDVMPLEKMFADLGVELKIGRVVSIDVEQKTCRLEDGDGIAWDKLVLATGSTPTVPGWLKGADQRNVFTVPKNKVYLDLMVEQMLDCRRVVTIGAGFIGVEISDELRKAGKEVVLVEKLPQILGMAFDPDVAQMAQQTLADRGVDIRTGTGVKEILGDGAVSSVKLDNGEVIAADAVVLTVGYSPNTKLAVESDLDVSPHGFIRVDEYLRTSAPDVFAVGDCAEKTDFVTRKPTPAMLASTACAEARVAGINLFKLSAVKTFSGTISIFSTAIGDTGFGVAGLTETRARAEGFDIITGSFEGMDKHPGALAGSHKQMVKLVAARNSGVILGAEVVGGLTVGELTNTVGFIIQNRMDINSILTSQIGTHPLMTASPAGYPLLKAAGVVARKQLGLV